MQWTRPARRHSEYFDDLAARQDIDTALGSAINELQGFQDASDAQKVTIMTRFFDRSTPLLQQEAAYLETVSPPSSIRDEHARLVQTVRRLSEASSTTAEKLRSAPSWAEARADALEYFVPSALHWVDACTAIQRIATANHIETGGIACVSLGLPGVT